MIMEWICTALFLALRSLYIEAIMQSHNSHTGAGAQLHDADWREMCRLVTAPPVARCSPSFLVCRPLGSLQSDVHACAPPTPPSHCDAVNRQTHLPLTVAGAEADQETATVQAECREDGSVYFCYSARRHIVTLSPDVFPERMSVSAVICCYLLLFAVICCLEVHVGEQQLQDCCGQTS